MKRVRFSPLMISAVLLLTMMMCHSGVAFAQESAMPSAGDKQVAADVAQTFLAQLDAGKYDETWSNISEALKPVVKQEPWATLLSVARQRVGNHISRRLVKEEPAASAPGGPDGQYDVLTYDSSFSKRGAAVEIVTILKDDDGKWRVFGYQVKPRK